jgi:signal transduction histidine kinase
MVNFWVSLIFLLVSWAFAVAIEGFTTEVIYMSGIFFALYFITPLLKRKMSQVLYLILPLLLWGMFSAQALNIFIWLMYLALALQSMRAFHGKAVYFYLGYLYLLAVFSYILNQEWLYASYLSLLALLTGVLLYFLYQATETKESVQQNYDALNDELRLLKRQLVSGEKVIRQEERNQIAREIHDSVGHRLTALLMQIEAARIQTDSEDMKDKFADLKQLAQQSLNETREAVKTLQSEETAGIQAIIQLIRKMEAESQLRLSITMQAGVLGVVLSNQQSVTIYRAVQEALTNMMRHSYSRQARIEFSRVAERDFRFEVSHPLKEKAQIKEGFGLSNMRERLKAVDGRLAISQAEGELTIIGQFPLEGTQYD